MQLTRRLAREIRTVFARALGNSRRGAQPPLVVQTGPAGLTLRIQSHEAAVEYRQAGDHPPQQFAMPLAALRECEGARHEPVSIERQSERTLLLRWTDGGVPQVFPVEVMEHKAVFPAEPAAWTKNPERLFAALADAVACTDDGSSRYALGCLQLRAAGQIAATDGRQLLLQSGFEFPWHEDLLVPANRVLACRDFAAGGDEVLVGRSGDWIVLRRGFWTLYLAIQKDARFPAIDQVIPAQSFEATTVHWSAADLAFLEKSLRRLPAAKEQNSPVTLDANGSIAVRARGGDRLQTTELILSGSRREGEAVRVCLNRAYLARAAAMGFRQLQITTPGAPFLCQDEHRKYVAALLEPAAAVPPGPDMLRLASPAPAVRGVRSRRRSFRWSDRQLQAVDG